MLPNSSAYLELLEILDKKDELLKMQDNLIRKLLEENLEKENIISNTGSLRAPSSMEE